MIDEQARRETRIPLILVEEEAEVSEEREEIRVHPVAAMFPMMTEDELEDLADDIEANGLIHPIVLDREGQIADGRNRYEACRRRQIAPQFTTLDPDADPVAYVLSANVTRRHLSKGQRAMAVVLAHSFSKNWKIEDLAREADIKKTLVGYAAYVLKHAPDVPSEVLAGAIPLDVAYDDARRLKQASEGRENSLARLREEAPDLAVLVQEERLSLVEALAALDRRIQEEKAEVRRLSTSLHDALTLLEPGNVPPQDSATQWLAADPKYIGPSADFSPARARKIAAVLAAYAQLKEEKDGS